MSKKESEFERYDRMKKLERESEVHKRKDETLYDSNKKLHKHNPQDKSNVNWLSYYENAFDNEF